jgi:hypothetical protein
LGSDGYTVRLTDGSAVWIEQHGPSLTVYVQPAEDLRGNVSGIIGNFDGLAENDMMTRDGTVLAPAQDGAALSHEVLYRKFGDSWRVTNDASLFTYASGQGTETFTDRSFPQLPMSVADFPSESRDRAREVCMSLRVTDEALLDACTFDMVVTGQPQFAVAAAQIQAMVDGVPASGAAVVATARLSISQPGAVATFRFAGIAGEKIFIDVPASTLPDQCAILTLRDPSGQFLNSGCILNGTGHIDETTLSTTGTFTITVDPTVHEVGHIQVRILRR